MRKLIKKLADRLVEWCQNKVGGVHYIYGGPKGDTAYLVRYIVFKSKWFCIYIHRFMRSDADDPHDHPWNFFTYIISGEYTECFYDRERPQKDDQKYYAYWTMKENVRKPGSLAYRRATDVHKVVLDRPYTVDEIDDAPYTICLMGPRKRHWGFWVWQGARWTDWRKYLKISPKDSRIEGSE